MMRRLLSALAALAALVPGISTAQSTAQPVLPGILTTSGCPPGYTSCFIPYSNSNPLPVTATVAPTYYATYATTQVALTSGAATSLVAARASRGFLMICNTSTTDVYLGFTSGVTTSTGELLVGIKGACRPWQNYTGAVYGIDTSGTPTLTVSETY
jgi:hypothetical protein